MIDPDETDPGIISLYLHGINAENFKYINILMSSDKAPSGKNKGDVFFETAAGSFSEENSLQFTEDVDTNGQLKWYTVATSANPNWSGEIKRLRIDPLKNAYSDSTDMIKIDIIELSNISRSNISKYIDGDNKLEFIEAPENLEVVEGEE